MAEDSTAARVKLHEDVIESDAASPLHLIREKELEISGRMLAAKRDADALLADARSRAAEIVSATESEGGRGAKAGAAPVLAGAETQAEAVLEEARGQAAQITASAEANSAAAVRLVVKTITTV